MIFCYSFALLSQVESIINHKTIIVKKFLKQSLVQPRFSKQRLIS